MKKNEKHLKQEPRNKTKAEQTVRVSDALPSEGVPPKEDGYETARPAVRSFFAELISYISASLPSDAAAAFTELGRGLLLGVVSLLFGRTSLLLDTYPLGIALLSASEKYIPYIFIGSLISVFTVASEDGVIFSPYIYLAAFISVMLIRAAAGIFIDRPEGLSLRRLFGRAENSESRAEDLKILASSLFRESVYLRMATACVAAFFVSLYAMKMGDYRFYDLFSAMFAMISAPAITFVFSSPGGESRLTRGAAEISLLSASVFALRGTSILGINAAAFIAFGASVLLARKKGVLYASAASLASGLAFSPIYAPAFVLSSICSGVMPGSVFTVAACASAISMLWGAYIDGFGAFTALMPAIISSSVFVCAADSLILLPPMARERAVSADIPALTRAEREESAEERFLRLSETFRELSASLYRVSDRLRSPGAVETRSICLRAFREKCASCPREESCRESYGEFSESVSKMSEILARDGKISAGALPPYISERCINVSEIADEANLLLRELVRERITGEKTELFALDYDAVSHIISQAIEESKRENTIDVPLSEKLTRALGELGMTGVYAVGERKKRIYCRNIGKKAEGMGSDELHAALEAAAGFPMKAPVFELRDGKVALRSESAPRFTVESASAVKGARGESVCGDSVSVFHNRDGFFYSVISDGMGSGQSASITSEISCSFLRTMLGDGNKKETALKMLNTLLRSKGEECSATVDLMEIDLIGGSACFMKSGAAPSFVRRGEKLYKLRSGTAPIGIMRGIDTEEVRFELSDGDVIIMLSDGIGQSPEESVWLMDMLGGDWDESEALDAVADRIVERAEAEEGEDDVSVVLVRVKSI